MNDKKKSTLDFLYADLERTATVKNYSPRKCRWCIIAQTRAPVHLHADEQGPSCLTKYYLRCKFEDDVSHPGIGIAGIIMLDDGDLL